MIRMGHMWLGKVQSYYDFGIEDGRSLFAVKPQIMAFINYDEDIDLVSGTLKIKTCYSKEYSTVMLYVETDLCILKFGKIEILQLLKYESLFKNHVTVVTNRTIHGNIL